MTTATQDISYGATALDGKTEFRVWAPVSRELRLRLLRSGQPVKDIPMQRDGEDFVAHGEALAGDRYFYVVDGSQPVPDPVSRYLPEGVHGPTEIVDPSSFAWNDSGWQGVPLSNYVIYELHVGTFTPEGTFDRAISRLTYLKQLGISVIEVMPVAATPGKRNWGYDGVSPYAVQANYGGPDALKRFVDAAHGLGIGVILDVVYNHLGPEGNYLPMFAPVFTARHQTPWGKAINYDDEGCQGVRRYVVQNALYWIREYHLDGLRLDAVQTIKDDSPKHILAEIQENVQSLAVKLDRRVCVIAETDENDAKYTTPTSEGGYGLDGVWSDDFHHAIHAYFTGERQGYYQDFGEAEQIARALRDGYVFQGEPFQFWKNVPRGTLATDVPVPANIICIQNHDQIGNRAKGERLSTLIPLGANKLAAALLLLAPHTPLLFMGEEYGESAPFQFFADFEDPALKKAVSDGRRSEFQDFDFDEVPDPEDPQTFERSKLTWADGPENRARLEWYRQLLLLRKQYVISSERRAEARYADGVLTVQIPAKVAKILVQAALQPSAPLPSMGYAGWRQVLQSDDDGYEVRIYIETAED